MSPEQARGEATTAAGDMYSFGLLLQELSTGEQPYERGAPLAVVVERASRGETVLFSGLDPDLTALIKRLQSLSPAARPSAVDTLERLQWIRRKPGRRRPPRARWRTSWSASSRSPIPARAAAAR